MTSQVVSPFLSNEEYAFVEASMPIVCTDFVPVLRDRAGKITHLGLITRHDPQGGVVWCHLGGRIMRGETARAAVLRHLDENLTGVVADLGADFQPVYLNQYFPEALTPTDGTFAGVDSRKHAVSLVFVVELVGDPVLVPDAEALSFEYVPVDDLPSNTWPGIDHVLNMVIRLDTGRHETAAALA